VGLALLKTKSIACVEPDKFSLLSSTSIELFSKTKETPERLSRPLLVTFEINEEKLEKSFV
jgi:hypothetical protein